MWFAARYTELRTFAAKFCPTVERTVNDRGVLARVEVFTARVSERRFKLNSNALIRGSPPYVPSMALLTANFIGERAESRKGRIRIRFVFDTAEQPRG